MSAKKKTISKNMTRIKDLILIFSNNLVTIMQFLMSWRDYHSYECAFNTSKPRKTGRFFSLSDILDRQQGFNVTSPE